MSDSSSLFSQDEPVDPTIDMTTSEYEQQSVVTVTYQEKPRYFDACRICGQCHKEDECPLRHKFKCFCCGGEHNFQSCPLYNECPVCGRQLERNQCQCGFPQTVANLQYYAEQCWKCGGPHTALICPQQHTKTCPSCAYRHDVLQCRSRRISSRMELRLEEINRFQQIEYNKEQQGTRQDRQFSSTRFGRAGGQSTPQTNQKQQQLIAQFKSRFGGQK